MKKLLLAGLALFFLSTTSYSQTEYWASKEAFETAKSLLKDFPYHCFRGFHRWWVCEYEDGTRVYNNPRCYRRFDDVNGYFTGLGGDCDAFYYDEAGRVRHLCYRDSRDVIAIAENFGAIVAIYPK